MKSSIVMDNFLTIGKSAVGGDHPLRDGIYTNRTIFFFFLDSDYSSLSRSIATQLLHNPHGDFLLTVGHRDHNIKRLDNEAAV